MTMGAVLDRADHGDVRGTFAFTVGDEHFSVVLTDDAARVVQDARPDPDVEVVADPATFFALADGRLTTARAVRESGLTVTGDRLLLDRLLTGFRLPARVAA